MKEKILTVRTTNCFTRTGRRYSVGIGSYHVSNVGQRMDFYAGDSGDINHNDNLTDASLHMSITSQGRVGIGTTSPDAGLSIVSGYDPLVIHQREIIH